jgi:hypothetical protein
VQFNVGGAISFSISVGAAGGDMPIAAKNVGLPVNVKNTGKPNENTARPKRGKRGIGKLRTAAVTATVKKGKKTWMMRLQHPGDHWL